MEGARLLVKRRLLRGVKAYAFFVEGRKSESQRRRKKREGGGLLYLGVGKPSCRKKKREQGRRERKGVCGKLTRFFNFYISQIFNSFLEEHIVSLGKNFSNKNLFPNVKILVLSLLVRNTKYFFGKIQN